MKDTNSCKVQRDGCFHENYVLRFTFAQVDVILRTDSREHQ